MTGIMDRFNTIFTFFNAFGYTVKEYENVNNVEAVSIGNKKEIIFVDTQTDGDASIAELAMDFCKMYDVEHTPTYLLKSLFAIYKNAALPEFATHSMSFGNKHSELAFMIMAHAREAFDDNIDVVEFMDEVVGIINAEITRRTQNFLSHKMDIAGCGNCDLPCIKNNTIYKDTHDNTHVRDIILGMAKEKIDLNILNNKDINNIKINDDTNKNIINIKDSDDLLEEISSNAKAVVNNTTKQEDVKKKGPKYVSTSEFQKHKYVNVPIQITYRLESDDDMVNRFDFGYITNKGSIKSLCSVNDNEKRFIISISILPITVEELKALLKK